MTVGAISKSTIFEPVHENLVLMALSSMEVSDELLYPHGRVSLGSLVTHNMEGIEGADKKTQMMSVSCSCEIKE